MTLPTDQPSLEDLKRLLRAAEEEYRQRPNKVTSGRVRALREELEKRDKDQ